jgi:hypothetical protein
VTEDLAAPTTSDDALAADDVSDMVPEWVYLPDIAQRYDLPLSRVRRFVADRELLTHRVGPNRALAVPAGFLGADGPLPELKGTFTVLADGGMNDGEIIQDLVCRGVDCRPHRPQRLVRGSGEVRDVRLDSGDCA